MAEMNEWGSQWAHDDLDKIPGPWKHGLPILGNVLEVLTPDFHRKTLEWADTYGPFVRIKLPWRECVMVTDPVAVAVINGRGEGSLDKAAGMYFPINQMVAPHAPPNLLTSPSDDKWKAIRKAVAVSFSVHNIKQKFPLILERVNTLMEGLRQMDPQQAVDVDQAALRVTLDVIGLAGFGHAYHSVEIQRPDPSHLLRVLPRCFTDVMLRIANPVRFALPALFKNGKKGAASFAAFQREMGVLLEEMRQRGEPGPGDTDIGAQLARVWGHSGIDDQRILSEVGILFVEGFETTGHTISWTLFNVATVPGVQDAIAEELDTLGLLLKPGQPPRELQLDDLKALRYLTACVKEAMRMYPVVSVGNGRVTSKPTRVGPYLIPPGVVVGTPLFALHNSRGNWPRPAEFLPQRWLEAPVEAYVLDARRLDPGEPAAAAAHAGRQVAAPIDGAPASPAVTLGKRGAEGPCFAPAGDADISKERGATGAATVGARPSGGLQNAVAASEHGGAPRAAAVPSAKTVVRRTTSLSGNPAAPPAVPAATVQRTLTPPGGVTTAHVATRTEPAPAPPAENTPAPLVGSGSGQERGVEIHPHQERVGSSEIEVDETPKKMGGANGDHPETGNARAAAAGIAREAAAEAARGTAAGGSSHRSASGGPDDEQLPAGVAAAGGAEAGPRAITFMPFSEGPRNCVGQSLAKMEVLAVLAKLLGTFRMELASEAGGPEGIRARESTHLTLQTKGTQGIRMRLTPRDKI